MMLFGIPKKNDNPSFSWRPFIIFGLVLVAALGLRVYQWIRGPVVPTADVPSVGWNEQMAATDSEIDRTDRETDVTDSEASEAKDPDDGVRPEHSEGKDPENSVGGSVAPEVVLPNAVNLAVPFTSQAPLGIWDVFTEETCEEASFAMVEAYYAGLPEGTLDAATVDADLRAMVAVEDGLGFGPSISTDQFVAFANAYSATRVRVVERPTVDDVRALLAQGNPVIVPVFGRKLGNPFFTGEGPLYHMLVLRGYTPTTFITNDPGTRHGENYQYAIDTFMSAIGDWDGDSPDGGARVLVIEH